MRAVLWSTMATALAVFGASLPAQTPVAPGDAALDPRRIRLARDSIVVLRVDSAGITTTVATLVRRVARIAGSDGDIFRETQHYVYAGDQYEFDTLDVSARTLELSHIAEVGPHTRNVLDARGGRLVGSVTPTDTTSERVDIPLPVAFHDMMLEAFVGAFPLTPGASLSLPTLRPPATNTRPITIDVPATVDTVWTASGPIECYAIKRRGRDVTTWVARADGHLVRMRWTNPDGSRFWKLPAADVPFLSAASPRKGPAEVDPRRT